MRLRVVLGVLLLIVLTVGVAGGQETPAPKRKRIGLVLGGGAALGWAHIGVLEWLEENKIPIDCIAGTSFGGMVGGFYATGVSPAEMRELIHTQDWNALLSGEPPYADRTFRRKEDRHDYPIKLEFGLKNGLRLPSGLDPAHPTGLLLSRYTLAYSDVTDFDKLPIPFHTVATDLAAAKSVVLTHGVLPRVLRAGSAIPAIFSPVVLEGRVLVDGGIFDNLPVDIARAMNADVLIVVNVTPLSPDAPLPGSKTAVPSFVELLIQGVNDFVLSSVKKSLKEIQPGDVLVSPDLTHILVDHTNGDALADRGKEAAERNRAALLALRSAAGVDDAAWQEYLLRRNAARAKHNEEFRPHFIEVVEADNEKQIYSGLSGQFSRYVGQPINKEPVQKHFENDLTTLTGSGRYESLSYEKTSEPGRGEGLRIRVKEKTYGPPFINLGLDVNNSDTNDVGFTLRGRLTAYDVLTKNAELRNDLALGSRTLLASEYYRPLGKSGWFAAPRLFYDKALRDIVQTDARIGEYRYEKVGASFDLGYTLSRASELRFGYQIFRAGTSLRSGDPTLPLYNGQVSVGMVRWTFDGQDRALVPTHGIKATTTGSWFLHAPGRGGRTFPQFETNLSAFSPLDGSRRNIIFGQLGGATSFGNHIPALQLFALGGPFRLGGYTRNIFQGSAYLYGSAGLLHRIAQILPTLGGSTYLGGWVETGSAFEDVRRARYHSSLTGGILTETFVGTAFIGGSLTQEGSFSAYFALGRLF